MSTGRIGTAARIVSAVALIASLLSGAPLSAAPAALRETPSLADAVARSELPPVPLRVPADPLVVDLSGPGLAPGKPGGSIETLFGRAKDIRFMVVYGYARLVGYDRDLKLVPDILAGYEAVDGRQFTFHLRPGHKWSDGHPFTAEDFRYYWEDMVLDPVISEEGPPGEMLIDGKLPRFEVLDPVTVRYTWDKPNPDFLARLAGSSPFYLYRPAHYLRQFHAKYADKDSLDQAVAAAKARDWRALHFKKDRQYPNDNPELPTLDPWVNTTDSPSDRYIFRRNPYFHRIDADGVQLPYLDEIVVNIANPKLIPLKTVAGEAQLQARGLEFKNYTVLKSAEKRSGYRVRLWTSGKGAQLALLPNLNVKDPVWNSLLRDVRFRRALSLGINRREINQVVFFGLGVESANTMLPGTPLHKAAYKDMWSAYDLERANRLLDEVGLTARDGEDYRLLPDGRPLEIVVETAGEDTNETDILELVKDSWAGLGVRLFTKPTRREVLRDRASAGSTVMSTWYGLENGIATAESSPSELAPSSDDQLQWPLWGLHAMTHGKRGEAPDDPAALRLQELHAAWGRAASSDERKAIWDEMLHISADQVFTIGIVCAVPQPVVVGERLRNVPEKALYNWEPGAYFGIYRPDTFWLDTR